MRLTRSSGRDADGRRFSVLRFEGQGVRVYDDADTALRIVELMADGGLDAGAKAYVLFRLLFVDPDAVAAHPWRDASAMLASAVWRVAYVDIDGSHAGEGGKRVLDWEADAERIEASVWQTYGVPFAEMARSVSFPELLSLIGYVRIDTPMGQALYYRIAREPRATRGNQAQIKAFRERRRMFALPDEKGAGDRAETDAFRALARAAARGRK